MQLPWQDDVTEVTLDLRQQQQQRQCGGGSAHNAL
jgi:hypothetical protein